MGLDRGREIAVNARSLGLLCAALSLAGCGGKQPVKPTPAVPSALVTPVVLAQVHAAPDSVLAAGTGLRLSTYLWRDFMPVSPPDGEPLRAVLRVTTADSSAFPPDLRADAAWVLNGPSVWATWVAETGPRLTGDSTLRLFAEGGPKWEPGVEVEVVVRVRDAVDRAWYLRAQRQVIYRTD